MAKAKLYPVIIDRTVAVELKAKPTITYPAGWRGAVNKATLKVIKDMEAGREVEDDNTTEAAVDSDTADAEIKAKHEAADAEIKEKMKAANEETSKALTAAREKADALLADARAEAEKIKAGAKPTSDRKTAG